MSKWMLVGSVAVLLGGCTSSTTVSQYAGLPRHLLPRDHVDFRPLHVGRTHLDQKMANSFAALTANSTTEISADQESTRLAKVMRICKNCMPTAISSPSYESTETLAAHDAAIARALREIQARP
jgi:hypothetical protein